MHFDWTVTIGQLLTVGGFIMSIIVAYYTMQRDTDKRFNALSVTVEAKSVDLSKEVDTKFASLSKEVDAQFAKLDLRLATIFEGDMRELRGRTEKLEIAQAELLGNLIERSHKLGDTMQTILLKVDRLERPTRKGRGGPIESIS